MSVVAGAVRGPVRLGFVGLGWIGRKRLDAIASDSCVEVAALFDSMPDRLDAAASVHRSARRAASVDELVNCGLDGVVIATPNAAHAQQALQALAQGVAVFCQKPLATTAAAAHRVIDAARAANRLLGVDFCYRHVAGMDEFERRLSAGVLGEITSIDLTFHNAFGPDKHWCFDRATAGGGCLLDLGVHLIDLALWLQRFPALELVSARRFAQGRPAGREAIEDQAYVELRQANGAIVRLACSWYAQIGCDALIEVRVLGTKGGVLWRNVGGSFYDFELLACRGSQREVLSRPPDEWGSRALSNWVHRLAQDRSFDASALDLGRSADLIGEVYAL